MATMPPYVAPNELIMSAWGNTVVDALTEHESELNRATEYRTGSLTLASVGITTSTVAVPNALSLGTRGFPRLAIVTAGILLTGAGAVNVDLWARCSPVAAGTNRRVRFAGAVGATITSYFYIAAGAAGATADAAINTSSGSATVSTVGGADFNYLQIQLIPIAAFSVIP